MDGEAMFPDTVRRIADVGRGTLCVHAGTYVDPRTGGACSPVFPSTAYAFPNAANRNTCASGLSCSSCSGNVVA